MLSFSLNTAPFFSLDAPEKQDFLIDFLASLGYKVTPEGVCFGFGEILSDDFLSSGQLTAFFQRLALMHYRVAVYGSSAKYFKHFDQKQYDLTQQGRLDEAQAIVEELKDIRDFSALLSETQAPFYYPEQSEGRYLGQLQKCARAYVLTPKAAFKKTVTCETPYVPVLHSKVSFTALLRHLQSACPHAFSMTVITNNHAITIHHSAMTLHYQPSIDASEQGQWLNVDPNYLYDLAFKSDLKSISEAIFKQNTNMVFGISVKMQLQHYLKLEAIESLLIINQSTDFVVSLALLQMACSLGDLDLVRRVLAANQTEGLGVISNKQILKSMEYAAKYNHLSVVQHLLDLSLDVSDEERTYIIHAALGSALKYGASEVVTDLLAAHPEYLLERNEAYNNQTLVMIAATNHVSLKLVLDNLDLQTQHKKTRVLQAVDVNQHDALHHARTNPVSFKLLLNCYLSDRELQMQFKDVVALQNLILNLMQYPAVLTLFIEQLSQNKRLLLVLKLAIVEALPRTLAIRKHVLQSHLMLVACSHYPDALTPLLSCLDEEDLTEHLQEKLGHVFDGMNFYDIPASSRSYVNVEKLSSSMSKIMKFYPELLLMEALLLFHPSRVPAVLNLLSEASLVKVLLLKGTLGSLYSGVINAIEPVFSEELQKELSEEKDNISGMPKALSMFNYVKLLDVRDSLSRLFYAKVQTSDLLDRVKTHISWLEEPVQAPIEQDVQLETFKTLIPKHQAMRTWFATCEPEVRLDLFQREGSLLFYAPHLFECIFSDLPPTEQITFLNAIIKNPANYLCQTIGLRAYCALAGILSPEQAYDLLKNFLTPDPFLGIVLFFAMEKNGLALLCERLNAMQTYEIVTQMIPPSGQTTLQILLGNPDDDAWCRSDLKLIGVLLKPLPSSQTRILLMEYPFAFYQLKQREPEVYQLILSRLDAEDILAIKEQYRRCVFIDGKLVLRDHVSRLGIFKTLIVPAVEDDLSSSEEAGKVRALS